jgi:hypothetical protein
MAIEIVPVRGRRALGQFIGVPWKIIDRGAWPDWVPPLRASVADAIGLKNPFWREAERELFLAYRDGELVGRIAAIENRAHNAYWHDRVGFFGFFESVDDPAVAGALLDAAERWLAAHGLDTMRGPMNPSTNAECGTLVEGYDVHPSFMETWNPPYYDRLMAQAGMTKAKDLLGFWIPGRFEMTPRWRSVIDRARERAGFRFRVLDPKHFERDASYVWDVYNSAWEKNWGFVPMSRAEFDHMAKQLQPLLVPEFAHFAEVDGVPVGITLTMPDYNLTMKRIPSGRLLPTGLFKLLLDKKRLKRGRIMMLGVKEQYRSHMVYLILLDEIMRRGRAYGGEGTDASWILEDNEPMLAFLRQEGITQTKRWRIYDRPIPTHR